MVKYGETYYGRHTVLDTSCSEVKKKTTRLPLETENIQRTGNQKLGFIKSLRMQQPSFLSHYISINIV